MFFGNLPPPFGGVSTYFAGAVPWLVAHNFLPILLIREGPAGEDYSAWAETGAVIRRMPDVATPAADARREIEVLSTTGEIDRIADEYAFTLRSHEYLSDLAFALRVASTTKPALIHTFHAYHRSVVALAAARLLRRPCVLTIFGEVIAEYSRRPELHVPVSRFLGEFDAILATSQHCASGVSAVGGDRRTVMTIPYGVDTEFYRPVDGSSIRERHGLGDRTVILFQGRLSPEKGPDVLLRALPRILAEVPDAVVLFVGPDESVNFEGPTGMTAEIGTLARRLGVSERVILTGAVPVDELPVYLSLADVLIFPSTTEKECMGLSIKQAMACGTPVVVGMAGGAGEAVQDGVTGRCCRSGDPEDLARATIEILAAGGASEMGLRARARAEDLFRFSRTMERTAMVYDRLLG
jgi:glycosyltransferase involved in cell wall biosynthesis